MIYHTITQIEGLAPEDRTSGTRTWRLRTTLDMGPGCTPVAPGPTSETPGAAAWLVKFLDFLKDRCELARFPPPRLVEAP